MRLLIIDIDDLTHDVSDLKAPLSLNAKEQAVLHLCAITDKIVWITGKPIPVSAVKTWLEHHRLPWHPYIFGVPKVSDPLEQKRLLIAYITHVERTSEVILISSTVNLADTSLIGIVEPHHFNTFTDFSQYRGNQ